MPEIPPPPKEEEKHSDGEITYNEYIPSKWIPVDNEFVENMIAGFSGETLPKPSSPPKLIRTENLSI